MTTAREPTGEDAIVLADALERFFDDLRYTAPELVGLRLHQLRARIAETMRVVGCVKYENGPVTANTVPAHDTSEVPDGLNAE